MYCYAQMLKIGEGFIIIVHMILMSLAIRRIMPISDFFILHTNVIYKTLKKVTVRFLLYN